MNFGGKVRINRVGFLIICALIIVFIFYVTPKPLNFKSDTVNLRRLLLASIEAAERGGREIVKVSKEHNLNEKSKGKTNEGANIPVTDADYKSHCVMYYGITKLFPSIRVISEESDGEQECENLIPFHIEPRGHLGVHHLPDEEVAASELTVWIDPLDATQEYTEMLYNYVTTMVCVAHKGNPIIGVIHQPFSDEPRTTWAWLNRGKSPNIAFVTDANKNKKPVAIVSRSHHGGNIEKLVKSILGDTGETVYAGGSGYKSLEVAVGNATVYLHKSAISKWDICAGDAIITALGGRFTTLHNQYVDYKAESSKTNNAGVLAASVYDHVTFAEKLKNINIT